MAAHRDPSPLPPIMEWINDNADDDRVTAKTPLTEAIRKIMTGEVGLAAPPTPFSLESGGWVVDENNKRRMYDPTARYMRATNKNDHSTVQRVHLPKEVVAAIAALVGWDNSYQNPADFIRNAIIHQLWRDWDAMANGASKDNIRQLLDATIMQAILAQHADEMETMRKDLASFDEVMEAAIGCKDFFGAKMQLSGCRARVETLREPYAGQMIELIEKWERRME